MEMLHWSMLGNETANLLTSDQCLLHFRVIAHILFLLWVILLLPSALTSIPSGCESCRTLSSSLSEEIITSRQIKFNDKSEIVLAIVLCPNETRAHPWKPWLKSISCHRMIDARNLRKVIPIPIYSSSSHPDVLLCFSYLVQINACIWLQMTWELHRSSSLWYKS